MKYVYSPLMLLTMAVFASGCCCADSNQKKNNRSDNYNNDQRNQQNLYKNQSSGKNVIKHSAYAVVKVLNLGLPRLIKGKNRQYIQHKNKFPVAIPNASHGSGIVISNKCLVATNEHVIRNGASLAVRFEDQNKTFAARLIAKSKKHDLALIQVDRANCPYTKNILQKPATVDRGTDVWKIGYGGEIPSHAMRARQAAVKQGTFSRMVPDGHGGQRYEISAPINGGDSGGLLIDKSGAVLGMLVAKLKRADGVGFVIPRPLIVSLVKVAAKKGWIQRERRYMATQQWLTHRNLSTFGAELVETDIKNLVRGSIKVRSLNNIYNLIVRDIKAKKPNSATIIAMVTLSSIEWNYAATLFAANKKGTAIKKLQRAMDLATLAVSYAPPIRKNPYVAFVLAFQKELNKRKSTNNVSINDMLKTFKSSELAAMTTLPASASDQRDVQLVTSTHDVKKTQAIAKNTVFPTLD